MKLNWGELYLAQMIGIETAIPIYISLFLQVIVLPSQWMNFATRKKDRTRLRFLLLTTSFIGFNLISMTIYGLFGADDYLSERTLNVYSLFLMVCTYHYLRKETKALENKTTTKELILALTITALVDQLMLSHLNPIWTNLILTGIAFYFSTILMKSASREKKGSSLIYLGALFACILACLIPIINFLIVSSALKLVCFNLVYFSIGTSYYIQHYRQLKLESTIVKSNSILFSSALAERTELGSLNSDVIVLTKRETEVLNLLLQNLDHQQVADKLNLTYDNARKHASNMYIKFDVSTNSELRDVLSRRAKTFTSK